MKVQRRWRWFAVGLALVVVALVTDGCVSPIKGLYPPAAGAPRKTVYIVSHGWHAGVVLPKSELDAKTWPLLEDFPNADYLEFGWGDAEYYPAERGSIWLAMKAACWPSASVIHVAGAREPLTNDFPHSDVVEVELSEAGFERLCGFIRREFQTNSFGQVIPAGKGLYGEGRFYRGRRKFYFPIMCNYWTASALRSAGCPIRPMTTLTSGKVISRTKKFGRLVIGG